MFRTQNIVTYGVSTAKTAVFPGIHWVLVTLGTGDTRHILVVYWYT